MKLDKLAKQLRRDASANPKKAALLGLMALAALYFWAPLAWKWLASDSGKKAKGLTASLILTDDPVEASANTNSRSAGKFRWEKVRQLIQQDPRMKSAAFELTWIDPFATRVIPNDAGVATAEGSEASAVVEPREAGLTLTSVAIGSRRRVATISGEMYEENDIVPANTKEDGPSGMEFRVARIRSQAVELEHGGRTFVLELNKPRLAQGDEIRRGSENRGN